MLKLRVKQETYESKDIKQYKKAKHICILPENSTEGSCPLESTAGVTYLSMRIHPKSYLIFPQKVTATLLSGSRKCTVGT